MPTNGNAGAAWAAYAARAGIGALIAMPVDAPEITRRECVVAGAELYLVDGLIGDAGAMVARRRDPARRAARTPSTLREPYRIEGKKTMGYEIVEQLGWRLPDVILYPTGGGVGIIAIHKALLELRELGWVTGDLPAAGRRAGRGLRARSSTPSTPASTRARAPADPRTVAFGITVPKALGDFLVLDAVRATGGTAVAVTDDDLLAAQGRAGPRRGHVDLPGGRGVRGRRRAAARSPGGSTAPRRSSCSTPAAG